MSIVCILTAVSDDEISRLHENPEVIDDFVENENRITTDLDKAWQGIHWLLNGSGYGGNAPLCYLLSGGQEVSFTDLGYGPPHTLTSEEVASWDDALSRISRDELAQRFNAEAMRAADIYPEIWEDPYSKEYLLKRYDHLKEFIANTRKRNAGLLIHLG